MAASSSSRNTIIYAVDDKEPIIIDDSKFVSEPDMTSVEDTLWGEELMIPHKLRGRTLAFAGPLPSSDNFNEDVSNIFPLHVTCEPKIFVNSVFDMSFFETGYRAFRSAPVVSEGYLKWLNKVEKQYATLWKESGIFDLIQLSREGPKYNAEMLIAALHFWENSTNTFHFKAGMMTPTLFDVAAITGLRPTGPTFDPKYTTVNHQFDFKVLSFSGFLKTFHDLSDEDVSFEEHIAFLTYWLSHFVLCTSSLQVVKRLVPLAIMLHQGLDVALGRFILASLYDSLGQASDMLKKIEKGSQLSFSGPIWLLQLWLNATFESNFKLFLPTYLEASVDTRQIEGARLALLRYRETNLSTRELFLHYFKTFLEFDEITHKNTLFVKRTVGPAWFRRPFPATNPDEEEDTNQVWTMFLNPTILSSRQGVERRHLGLVGYQPNLVARQFGLSQFRPKSLFKNKDDIVLGNSGMSVEYFERRLKLADERKPYKLTPVAFETSQYCTFEFATWWSLHYEKHAKQSDEVLLQAIEAGFDALQQKTPKSKGASKAKDVNTSTDTTTPAATQKKTLPNTGAKLRKRNLMASSEAGGPTKQKKQKALTINEPTPAGNVNPTAAAPSGEGQRDKGKASVETSEASMPPNPKKKTEKKKKKKVKPDPKPSAGTEKDAEIPVSNPPVEDQSNANVETPSTGGPILEKINPSLQDPGAQGGNEENTTTPVNNEENSAQDVGTNRVEVDLTGTSQSQENEEIPTNNPEPGKTITVQLTESTHSSENTDVEMETDADDDIMPEATEGGSDILPVSSTSKLSAEIGISEMQFIAMKDSDPAAALKMLLSSKGSKERSKGTSHHSSSTASDTDISSTVRQDSLLLKLHTDYVNQDVFALIEANPSSAFSHLGFLKKLHNPLTDEATLSKVIQLENLIDGFTQAIQRKKMNTMKLEAQTHAHAALVEKAKTAQANVERFEKEIESNAELTEYTQNIAAWEGEIAELHLKIQSLNAKIDAEKIKRDEAKANLTTAVKAWIDKEANEGIKSFSASAAVEEEIQNLEKSSKVLDKEVSSFKSLYEDLKNNFNL
ncbi:serine/threonine-protein phosphatase 7 long form protein [Trifolium repens]|nr:serine/threonine-protein phosphatase 7 long form protein [Trifolium repens]